MPRNKTNTATKLPLISQRSITYPQEKFTSLAHLLNEEYLIECYKELKKKKAPGIDGKMVESYREKEIKQEITKTVEKMKAKRYNPKPVRRVYIAKGNGKQRPLGIPTVIDKIIQQGIKKILEAIYEPHFMEFSYGFRPNRGCHQAVKAVYKMIMDTKIKKVNWIIDVDIKEFFDNVNHHWMIESLNERIRDRNFRNIIIKFLKAGIMEEGKYYKTEQGTPQGGIMSPVLANIYLHYVLDLWFTKADKKRLRGYAEIVRYADDFVIGTQHKEEVEKILEDLKERFKKFNLEIAEEKTKIIEFGRFAQENRERRGERKPETFDFLGFTFYCSRSTRNKFIVKTKTSRKKMRLKTIELNQYLKKIRNIQKPKEIWKTLNSKLTGHYNYYGISGNFNSIKTYYNQAIKITYKWMNRRSQKKSFNWQKFNAYLEKYPLRKPTLVFNMYNIW